MKTMGHSKIMDHQYGEALYNAVTAAVSVWKAAHFCIINDLEQMMGFEFIERKTIFCFEWNGQPKKFVM